MAAEPVAGAQGSASEGVRDARHSVEGVVAEIAVGAVRDGRNVALLGGRRYDSAPLLRFGQIVGSGFHLRAIFRRFHAANRQQQEKHQVKKLASQSNS